MVVTHSSGVWDGIKLYDEAGKDAIRKFIESYGFRLDEWEGDSSEVASPRSVIKTCFAELLAHHPEELLEWFRTAKGGAAQCLFLAAAHCNQDDAAADATAARGAGQLYPVLTGHTAERLYALGLFDMALQRVRGAMDVAPGYAVSEAAIGVGSVVSFLNRVFHKLGDASRRSAVEEGGVVEVALRLLSSYHDLGPGDLVNPHTMQGAAYLVMLLVSDGAARPRLARSMLVVGL